jgi:hypothetical protein
MIARVKAILDREAGKVLSREVVEVIDEQFDYTPIIEMFWACREAEKRDK